VVAITCAPNTNDVGKMLATGAIPVPVRVALCADPVPLSVTTSVAVLEPRASGLKTTMIEQLKPAPRLVPQLFVCAKSVALVPVIETLLINSGASPVLDRVAASPALGVLTSWLINVSDPGASVELVPMLAVALFENADFRVCVCITRPVPSYPLKATALIAWTR